MDEINVWAASLTWLPVALTAMGTVLTGLGVRTTKQQVDLQQELAREAAQPYVWADVRGSDHTGFLLEVMVGNSGDTVATDVEVTFDPPLPVARQMADRDGSTSRALERLESGLRSLSPGKTLSWTLGTGADLLESTGAQPHTVTIDAQGPFGPLPTLEYVVDLSDFRESADRPSGSLHLLTRAVEKGFGQLKKG